MNPQRVGVLAIFLVCLSCVEYTQGYAFGWEEELDLALRAVDEEKEKCGGAADIAFVLDSSRSIYYKDFEKEKEFVANLVQKFNVKPEATHVAALQFAYNEEVEFNFNDVTSADDVIGKVAGIQQSNGAATYTHKALKAARTQLFDAQNGARPNVPRILILLSDGASTAATLAQQEAERVKAENITIMTIGIGSKINRRELEKMCTAPASENFFYAANFNELKNPQFQNLVGDKACDNNEKPDESCQGKEADVVFVLDESSSIWPPDFEEQLKFVNDVVDVFDVNSGKARIGALTFSNGTDVIFDLNSHQTTEQIHDSVLAIEQNGGVTNTYLAIQLVMERMFTKRGGSRPSAAHICILITDGRSQKTLLTAEMAARAKDSGIYMFAIGVGKKTDPVELAAIASEPTQDFKFEVNGYDALENIKDILAYKTCKTAAAVAKVAKGFY